MTELSMEKIPVPAVTHPTLCYQTPPLVGPRNPMIHCTKPKGHAQTVDVKHSWEK